MTFEKYAFLHLIFYIFIINFGCQNISIYLSLYLSIYLSLYLSIYLYLQYELLVYAVPAPAAHYVVVLEVQLRLDKVGVGRLRLRRQPVVDDHRADGGGQVDRVSNVGGGR